jgi:hypothetical protein
MAVSHSAHTQCLGGIVTHGRSARCAGATAGRSALRSNIYIIQPNPLSRSRLCTPHLTLIAATILSFNHDRRTLWSFVSLRLSTPAQPSSFSTTAVSSQPTLPSAAWTNLLTPLDLVLDPFIRRRNCYKATQESHRILGHFAHPKELIEAIFCFDRECSCLV